MGVFIYIFFDHAIECYEHEDKYKKNQDKWIREYIINDYINTNNKSFKLLISFLKHPFFSSGTTKYYLSDSVTFKY